VNIIWEDDLTTIIHGDALKVIPKLTYDTVITSPPYNMGRSSTHNQKTGFSATSLHSTQMAEGYDSYSDDLPWEDYTAWQSEFLTLAFGNLPPHGSLWYNIKARIQNGILIHPISWIPPIPLRQIVIWDRKGDGINFSKRFLLPSHELILLFAKPDWRLHERKDANITDVWHILPEKKNKLNPCPFPLSLPSKILSLRTSEVVLDPFMGSGTTLLAARKMGIKSIGIDISESYCKSALTRIFPKVKL
jgi:modification methylase